MTPKKKARLKSAESILPLVILTAAIIIGVAAGNYLGRMDSEHFKSRSVRSISGKNRDYRTPTVNERQEERAATANRRAEQRSVNQEPHRASDRLLHGSLHASKPDKPATQRPGLVSAPHKSVDQPSREPSRHDGANLVALTFDAGASSAPTPSLLDTLKSAGLRVTFFLTGKWCERNRFLVSRIVDEGHEVANHTYSHPDLRKLTDQEIRYELAKTDEIVQKITGQHCAPYFRPPYGARDKRVIEAAREAGYTCVYWSLDTWDAFKRGITADEIKQRVISKVKPGDIVLMHCGSWATAEALPAIIRELESRDFRIVPVSELIAPP